MGVQLVYVNGDDWVGLYVDGKLKDEGHSLQFRDLFDILEKVGKIDRAVVAEPDDSWLVSEGGYPPLLKDVKLGHGSSFPAGLLLE